MTKTRLATTEASRLDIVQGILDLIATRELEVNSMTSENELARKLKLNGRSPVLREALALLTRDGIVQPYPQRGYLIREISSSEAKEILRLRGASLRLVVEKLVNSELDLHLDGASSHVDQMSDSARQNESATFLVFEGRVCCELARLSELFTAPQVLGAWSDQLTVFHALFPLGCDEMEEIADRYRTLLGCLEQRDRNGAISTVELEVRTRIDGLAKRGGDTKVSTSVQEVTYTVGQAN